jgi:hypothetical protein
MAAEDRKPVTFLAFFVMWARLQGWRVPLLHVRICTWLETCVEPERVLMVFRGAAKSTIYAVYKAWKLYRDRHHRSLVWSADNDTAGMLTADTINVLRNHPLTRGMLPKKPGAKRFWVVGARDARNASMRANGVNTNATGARADDVDFDDVEVPGNVETPQARAKLRQRISESTHIAVPGAQKTYIGTPHTHDSIYPEQIAAGAASLKIPLFEHALRFDKDMTTRRQFRVPFDAAEDGFYVMAGIYKPARMLVEGVDYTLRDGVLTFPRPPGCVIDVAACCNWPERFTREEIGKRRKETLTLNAWDSQYMLEAKPIGEIRLDPELITAYECEPEIRKANRVTTMWLGAVQITGCALHWDPSSGKLKSDVSAAVFDLQDGFGRHYWHRALGMKGAVAETSEDGHRITGGQVMELCDLIEKFRIPRVTVETNGLGDGAEKFLKMALKQRKLNFCGVTCITAVENKNKRILEALEPLLQSGMLWAHTSVLDGPLWDQMKDWNPATQKQADDYLDAGSGAVTDQPTKIGAETVRNEDAGRHEDWRPNSGVFEATLEF